MGRIWGRYGRNMGLWVRLVPYGGTKIDRDAVGVVDVGQGEEAIARFSFLCVILRGGIRGRHPPFSGLRAAGAEAS